METKICLLSTLHDPAGKLGPFIRDYFSSITLLYDQAIILVTDQTHQDNLPALGDYALIRPTNGMANARREVLRAGLDTDCDYFHLIDFDRLLFWFAHFPDELREVIEIMKPSRKFILLTRSREAFMSHPELQRLTERACNLLFFKKVGYNLDILSGSRGIPRKLGYEILEKSRAMNGAALDAEWPLLVGVEKLSAQFVNGLAYEHSFLGIEKPYGAEVRERIANLHAVAEVILSYH